MREFLRAKVHNARVTKADLEYEGSLGLDSVLIRKAGLRPFESVEIYNISNGGRIRTYLIELPPHSGRCESNGAAAHLIREGDRIIIAAYQYLNENEIPRHKARVLIVDEKNTEKTYFESDTDFRYPENQ